MKSFRIRTSLTVLSRAALLIVALAWNVGVAAARPLAVTLSKLVSSADPDPLGGAFSSVYDPLLLTSQRVAFTGDTTGLFRKSGGSLLTIAAFGDASPIGGTFVSFGLPFVNSLGVTVFRATVDGAASSQGIFVASAGVITPAVLVGDPAPGGGTFSTLFNRQPSANASGDIAFGARVGLTTDGIFLWSGGAVSLIAREGDAAPGGGTYQSISTNLGPSVNNSGDVVFGAQVRNSLDVVLDGVFRFSGGVVSPVVWEGDSSPVGGTFRSFGRRPSLNNLGDVVFMAAVKVGGTTKHGVFLASPSICSPLSVCSIAVDGDAAPAPGGGVFNGFSSSMIPGINDAGVVAFPASVASSVGLFLSSGGVLSQVVRAGDPCPLGGTYQGLNIRLSLNASTELAFRASCTAGTGIFRFPPGGPVSPVALSTDSTPIGDGFSFSNPSIDGAGAIAFNGGRTAVFSTKCKSSGCASASPVAAPTDPVRALPKEFIDLVVPDSLAGSAAGIAFIAGTFGANSREGLFLFRNGALRKIAMTGESAPDAGDASFSYFSSGGTLLGYSIKPSLSGRNIAFVAGLSDNTTGIFLWKRGRLLKVVRQGDPAPGGGTFAGFEVPALSGGKVAVLADTGVAICVFEFTTSGSVSTLACKGDSAPSPVGGTIGEFLSPPVIGRGKILFQASVLGGASSECIFRQGKTLSLETVACQGDVAPVGGNFKTFTPSSGIPWFSVSGWRLASFAQTSDGNDGMFVFGRYGSATKIAVVGDPVPAPIGGTFSEVVYSFSLHASKIVFEAYVAGGTRGDAIFLGRLR
jgi:hypothetical protein